MIQLKQTSFLDISIIEQEAINFLCSSIGNDVAFVGFSGGKDSIVTAKLCELAGIRYELYYSFTGLDAPQVVRFIRKHYPHCKFLMPKRTFWRDLSVNAPPSDSLRWCCRLLKKRARMEVASQETCIRQTFRRVTKAQSKRTHKSF